MPKLVELSATYFDEISVNCFVVFTDDAFIKWVNKLENYQNKLEWYFDNSIPVEWESGKQFYDECNIIPLTEEKALILGQLFPSYNDASGIIANFGAHCIIFNNILDI